MPLGVDDVVFGKNKTQRIVACEPHDATIDLFIEEEDGSVNIITRPNRYWILLDEYFSGFQRLSGNQTYKYIRYFTDENEWTEAKKWFYRNRRNLHTSFDPREGAMIDRGFTFFKGMKVDDVSVLAFDIETTGLQFDINSEVLIIANTFRCKGEVTRKLFSVDKYRNQASMIVAWCNWVREVDPTVMLGHNIYTYDLPYLQHVADIEGITLELGRDDSVIKFNERESKFRKDGSQFYHYKRAHVYGRNLIDTMFLSVKFDIKRKYESYGLKQIIKQEGLEAKDRQFYDAATIKDNWHISEEREKIKAYAMFDGDDALALYDLMIPAFFYLTQSVPKPFEEVLLSAPGSQINTMLVRSYLSEGCSIPEASPIAEFEGAISIGNPGVYKNVFKKDISSLYPSIILQYQLYDKYKDPNGYFLAMAEYLTAERLKNKQLAKDTGDRYYEDVEQAQKTTINSMYGVCGTPGINFNSSKIAAFITETGRDILTYAIEWASSNGFKIVNADTDSISITRDEYMDEKERQYWLSELNALMPEKIVWADDGYFSSVLVVKAKNYALWDDKKMKIKGSALKATMKELALKEFLDKAINILMFETEDKLVDLYYGYVKEIMNITNISRWTSKKTITDKVLDPKRTNEQKVFDAIADSDYKESDKIRVFFDVDGNLKLEEHWNNDHDHLKLLEKLHKTLMVLEPVVDKEKYPKFTLKKNREALQEVLARTA